MFLLQLLHLQECLSPAGFNVTPVFDLQSNLVSRDAVRSDVSAQIMC